MTWLAFYNPEGIGDVLLLTRGNSDENKLIAETQEQVTLVKDRDSQEVLGVNFHEVSKILSLKGQGQIFLTDEQVKSLKDKLQQAGFQNIDLAVDNSPKFVVGYVEECKDHEDSDHLHVTKTRVSDQEVLQIVCGAANIAQGLKVIVAKEGAVMPSGAIIWPGELRGVASSGMICSKRELGLEQEASQPGIWILPDKYPVGTSLEQVIVDL